MLKFRRQKSKKNNSGEGKLIVIEGLPGGGREIQIELLAEALGFAGFKVATIAFPKPSTISSKLIETYLKGDNKATPEAKALMFSLNHMEANDQIKEELEKGTMILASGFTVDNAARHAAEIQEPAEQLKFFRWISHLEHNVLGVPRPHLSLILHTPSELAEVLEKEIKLDEAGEEITENLVGYEEALIKLSKLYPQTKLIECVKDKEILPFRDIHNQAWNLVLRIVLKNKIPA